VSGLLDRWVRVGLVTVVGSTAVAVSLGMTPIQFGAGAPETPSVEALGQFGRQHPRDDEQSMMTREMQRTQAKRLQEQRQQQVLSDTAKLLLLATELKAEVDKREQDPSVAVIKDADEIGKLAKRVSEKIKAQ
jgi:hypothetical protein